MTRSHAERLGTALAAAAALAGLVGGCGAEESQKRDPVIFVHGCPPGPPLCSTPSGAPCTNEQESGVWLQMVAHFKARGYPDSLLNRFVAAGPPCDSALTQAEELSRLVGKVRAATGASKVDIVAHSMGALTTRLYLLESSDQVDDFVSIGGGNHGSLIAAAGVDWQAKFGAPAYEGAKELFPAYACEGRTVQAADVQFKVNGCLTPSGRTAQRDETPGRVSYLSIWNSADEIVSPRESSCLNQRFQNDCSDTSVNVKVSVPPGPGPCGPDGCPAHVTMLWDPGVMQKTLEFVACEGDDDPRCQRAATVRRWGYAADWLRVIPDLVTTHRMIAPDLPGHGNSEVADGPLDSARVLAWLERHDQATPLWIAEAASARYGWPLHVIENAADDPPIEQPEALLRAMGAALGTLPGQKVVA